MPHPDAPNGARPFIAQDCVCCSSPRLSASPAVLMPFVAHRVFGWRPVEITEEWGLRTISSGMAYSICNSLRCEDCGHLFLDMRFTEEQMMSLYQNYFDEDYARLRESYEPGYLARNEKLLARIPYLDKIEAFLAPLTRQRPTILDWGGGRGQNTPFANTRERLFLYDISGAPPVEGAVIVDSTSALDAQYDLVICSNVLEHVSYPQDLMRSLRQTLNPQTVLYLEVPYEPVQRRANDGPEALQRKRHWHEHVSFFSHRSLRTLIEDADLDILKWELVDVGEEPGEFYNFFIACRLT